MTEFDSPKQLITNLFELTRDSLDEVNRLKIIKDSRGDYNCREVTELDREVYHTVVSAEHSILGPVRVQLTSGVKRPPYTADNYSVYPKSIVEHVTSIDQGQSFFMVAVRPQPIESLYPRLYVNPVIFVAGVQDERSKDTGVAISSFWEVLDSESREKIAGNLQQLQLSTAGIFFPKDRAVVDSFVTFSQQSREWGTTGTLRRIYSRLRYMKVEKLTQYDLFAGTKSKVTYPSVPVQAAEIAA